MLHVLLDWQKIAKTILKKAFSVFCGVSSFFLVFVAKTLKNGASGR
jgi:hypothetical protein